MWRGMFTPLVSLADVSLSDTLDTSGDAIASKCVCAFVASVGGVQEGVTCSQKVADNP